MRLGANVHAFEAGMMAGFLTAAKMHLVHVNETLCCENGSEFCRFATSDRYEPELVNPKTAERFLDHLGGHIHEMQRAESHVPEEYYLLTSMLMMRKDYSNEVGRIMASMGSRLAGKMQMTRSNVENSVRLLGLGEIYITSLKPLKGSVSYSGLRAREEFVRMAMPFLDGLLSGIVGRNSTVEVTATANANRYNVKLTEKKAINVR